MPNWCTNTLTFNQNIKHAILNKDNEVSFDILIPEPKELLDDSASGSRNLQSRFGTTSWYDWRCKHWGCKWDAKTLSLSDPDEQGNIEATYDTPWGVPEPWLEHLFREYPDSEIKGTYVGEGVEYAGEFYNDEGDMVTIEVDSICHQCYEFDTSEGYEIETDHGTIHACSKACVDELENWYADEDELFKPIKKGGK